MDRLSPERRSWLMSRVRSKNTGPELILRSILHGLGYRFRLHGQQLPGKPDIVFSKRKKVIFVHGCFWHGHAECRFGRLPKSNVALWKSKIERNKVRDKKVVAALTAAGWTPMVVWQCELKELPTLEKRIASFLGKPRSD